MKYRFQVTLLYLILLTPLSPILSSAAASSCLLASCTKLLLLSSLVLNPSAGKPLLETDDTTISTVQTNTYHHPNAISLDIAQDLNMENPLPDRRALQATSTQAPTLESLAPTLVPTQQSQSPTPKPQEEKKKFPPVAIVFIAIGGLVLLLMITTKIESAIMVCQEKRLKVMPPEKIYSNKVEV